MTKKFIQTNNAPQAIGTYSQAVKVNDTVYLSGQIPLVAQTMEMVSDKIQPQIHQVFNNIQAVCQAADGELSDIVKLNIYLQDLRVFDQVNQIMADYFTPPYPARAAVEVAALPKNALIEIDAVMVLQR